MPKASRDLSWLNYFRLNALDAFQVEVHQDCFVAWFGGYQASEIAFRVEILSIEICIYGQEAAARTGFVEKDAFNEVQDGVSQS